MKERTQREARNGDGSEKKSLRPFTVEGQPPAKKNIEEESGGGAVRRGVSHNGASIIGYAGKRAKSKVIGKVQQRWGLRCAGEKARESPQLCLRRKKEENSLRKGTSRV